MVAKDGLTLDCRRPYAHGKPKDDSEPLTRKAGFGRGQGGATMRTKYFATASALLLATVLTPAIAADMTFERGLRVQSEPQNWLLHHGNYEGHRFSPLTEINADNA